MGAGRVERIEVEPGRLLDELARLKGEGYNHLVTITGLDEGEGIGLIYHLAKLEGGVVHVHTTVAKGEEAPTAIPVYPGAYIYEMEVHDMFGLSFAGNPHMGRRLLLPDCYPEDEPPLLKSTDPAKVREKLFAPGTVCLQGPPISGMSKYSPESFVVPFGPYHPALKEPEHFSLIVEGERIIDAVPRIGFVHRGVEKAAEQRSYLRDIFLLERICGICSMHHSLTFVLAVENLLGIEVSERASYLRTLVAELERIHSHSLWLGLVGYWMGFETMFMWVWTLREIIMELLELVAGNRVNKSIVTIGGVRRDLDDAKLRRVGERIREFGGRFEKLIGDILSLDEFIDRTSGIGVYSRETARALSTVGPVRRAVGDPYDMRRVEPYCAYPDLDFKVVTAERGDVYNLVRVRTGEILESVHIIEQIVDSMPPGEAVPKKPFMGVVKKGEAYARTEAPRGELFHYVAAGGKHNPERVKVRTPTLANIMLAAEALKGQTVSDVPLVVTMIDPCFSCMDRVLVADRASGEKRVLTDADFHRMVRERWRR